MWLWLSVVMFVPTTNTKCLRSCETWAQRVHDYCVCVCVCDSAASPLLELIRRCGVELSNQHTEAVCFRANPPFDWIWGRLVGKQHNKSAASVSSQSSDGMKSYIDKCHSVNIYYLRFSIMKSHTVFGVSHKCLFASLVINMDRFCVFLLIFLFLVIFF